MIVQFKYRRGTSADWSNANPVLAEGEPGYDTTVKQVKVGDGVTAWNDLGFQSYDTVLLEQTLADVNTASDSVADSAAAVASDRNAIESQFSVGAWPDYGGAVAGVPSATNITRYHRIGNRVTVNFAISPTGAATGEISLELPYPALGYGGTGQYAVLGVSCGYDVSGAEVNPGSVYLADTNHVKFQSSDGGVYNASFPWAWAAGDKIGGTFSYETAL